MRIARVQTEDGPRAGVVQGEVVRVLAAEVDVLDLLGAERERFADRVVGEAGLE